MNIHDFTYRNLMVLGRLCVLRGSPADLPYSRSLLVIFIFMEYCLQFIGLNEFLHQKLKDTAISFEAGLVAFFSTAIYLGAIYFLLYRKKQTERFNKAMLALFGTELLTLAFTKLLFFLTQDTFILLIINAWIFCIWGYIIKQTLMVSLLRGIFTILVVKMLYVIPFFFLFLEHFEHLF